MLNSAVQTYLMFRGGRALTGRTFGAFLRGVMPPSILLLAVHPDPGITECIAAIARTAGAEPLLASTTYEGVLVLAGRRADIIVLRAESHLAGAFESIATFRRMHPNSRILVISESPSATLAVQSLRAGADDIVAAKELDDTVFLAINSAPCEVQSPATDPSPRSRSQPALGEEAQRVLRMRADGLTNKEVAVRMNCSEKTIERRIGEVMSILGIKSRREMLAYIARLRA